MSTASSVSSAALSTAISETGEAIIAHLGASAITKSPTLENLAVAISNMPEPAKWSVIAGAGATAGAFKEPVRAALRKIGPIGAVFEPYLTEILESVVVGGAKSWLDFTKEMTDKIKVKAGSDAKAKEPLAPDKYWIEPAAMGLHTTSKCAELLQRTAAFELANTEVATVDMSNPKSPKKTVIRPAQKYRVDEADWEAIAKQTGLRICPCCGGSLVKILMTGAGSSSSIDPPKPKAFEDTLSEEERWVFGRLVDRAMSERGLAAALVQRAFEEDAWSKIRLLKDLLNEGTKGVEPTNDLYQRFVRRVDAVFNPRLKDRLAGHLDTATDRISHWISERNWKAVVAVVAGIFGILLLVIGLLGYGYLRFTYWSAEMFFLDGWYHGQLWKWMAGTVLLTISMLLLIPIQGLVDWFMDQFRIVGQRLGFNVTPATTSVPWLRNLGFSGAFFTLFFGAVGLITVGLAGGIQARSLLIVAAMLSTAAVVGYSQVRRMDIWESKFLRTVTWVGAIPLFAVLAALMARTEWAWEPVEARVVQGTTNEFVVVYSNPYDQTDDGEYSLEEVFGVAATKHGMVTVSNGHVYSEARLVANLPGALEVRVREDGFGHFTYDLKPDRFPEELDKAKAKKAQAEELASVIGGQSASTASSAPVPSMWGCSHTFWAWILVVSPAVAVAGGLLLAVLGAQDESQSGTARGFRAAGSYLAILAVLFGSLVFLIVGVSLLVDCKFGFGDDPNTSAQIVQPAPAAPTAVPSQPAAASSQVAPTTATTSHPPAASTPSGKRKQIDCSRIQDPVNHATCLRSSGH
ncbi:MAG: hypothetical protein WC702_03570 [Patescibacteria group bacterium]|jgi:hypothetical protein